MKNRILKPNELWHIVHWIDKLFFPISYLQYLVEYMHNTSVKAEDGKKYRTRELWKVYEKEHKKK